MAFIPGYLNKWHSLVVIYQRRNQPVLFLQALWTGWGVLPEVINQLPTCKLQARIMPCAEKSKLVIVSDHFLKEAQNVSTSSEMPASWGIFLSGEIHIPLCFVRVSPHVAGWSPENTTVGKMPTTLLPVCILLFSCLYLPGHFEHRFCLFV